MVAGEDLAARVVEMVDALTLLPYDAVDTLLEEDPDLQMPIPIQSRSSPTLDATAPVHVVASGTCASQEPETDSRLFGIRYEETHAALVAVFTSLCEHAAFK
jgi:hypothetical protein